MAAVSTSNRVTPLPQADSGPAILVVEDIVMRFGSAEDGVTALDNVSFTVAPGEFLAVIGPSGCGKSTLFNIIGGLLGGYDGRVAVAGEKVSGPHASIGMVFQEESTFPVAQCRRQCRLPAGDRRHAQARAHRARAAFRVHGRPRRFREALSGRALRRHAPARVDGAHARVRAENFADGRAVRRARRADAASARRQGAADPAAAQSDHAADHPQHHRGGAARRPHPGDDLSPRPGEAHRRYQAAAAAHLGDRVERGVRPLRRANLGRSARGSEPRAQRRRVARAARGEH